MMKFMNIFAVILAGLLLTACNRKKIQYGDATAVETGPVHLPLYFIFLLSVAHGAVPSAGYDLDPKSPEVIRLRKG